MEKNITTYNFPLPITFIYSCSLYIFFSKKNLKTFLRYINFFSKYIGRNFCYWTNQN